jgi:hypothetical protein
VLRGVNRKNRTCAAFLFAYAAETGSLHTRLPNLSDLKGCFNLHEERENIGYDQTICVFSGSIRFRGRWLGRQVRQQPCEPLLRRLSPFLGDSLSESYMAPYVAIYDWSNCEVYFPEFCQFCQATLKRFSRSVGESVESLRGNLWFNISFICCYICSCPSLENRLRTS